ncbi:MAG: peptidoglycan-associated lipoprotein Pal [Acidobacteriia bacterium]|nr:peptidoglycan-associated lipoprotein Pal [Terriglobia bacterium]
MRSRLAAISAVVLMVPLLSAGSCRRTQPIPPAASAAPERNAVPARPPGAEPKKEVTESFPTQPVTSQPLGPESTADELNRKKVLATIYFDYDKSDLSDAARATLQANADWLKANPARVVRIEGNCDERGTVEYNLALGQRRAASVRDYLGGLGVDASRLKTISYGKERPADPGHDDAARAKNRRAEFVIES